MGVDGRISPPNHSERTVARGAISRETDARHVRISPLGYSEGRFARVHRASRGVAVGEMVACDDNECEFEWFHYACVGLTKVCRGGLRGGSRCRGSERRRTNGNGSARVAGEERPRRKNADAARGA